MSDLDLQQVLGSRYKTSLEADGYTDQLRQQLALETKAQVARLAIGRSLAMGKLPESAIDGQGRDIPATSLFSTENVGAWVGLLVAHALTNGGPVIVSMDGLRLAIRAHWHRGALSLWADWKSCDQNYDKFIETMVERRSDMPEVARKKPGAQANGGGPARRHCTSRRRFCDLDQGNERARHQSPGQGSYPRAAHHPLPRVADEPGRLCQAQTKHAAAGLGNEFGAADRGQRR